MISRKQLHTDQNSPRWTKVKNETFYHHIAELNVVQNKIYNGDLSFLYLFYSSICQLYKCKKLLFYNGI